MSPFLPPKVSIPIPATPVPAKQRPQTHSTRRSSEDTHRSSSISSWVKQMLPSHRPERRGTLRRRGFWEQQELIHPGSEEPRRSATGRRSRRSGTVGSNHIVEWNMARNLSDCASIPPDCEVGSAADVDRKWSWIPGDGQKTLDRNHNPGPLGEDDNRLNVAAMQSSGSQSLSTTDLQFIEAKKESRRLRRNLKESGDYLGVQGFNPETGRLDVVTPTESDRSSGLSQETQQKLLILQHAMKDARHSYKSTVQQGEKEAKKILLKSEKEKLRRLEKEKEEAKDTAKAVKWKRHTRQWSSAQEPDLSPIAQSVIETDEISRKESQQYGLKETQRDSMSSLIDFDSSELPIAASMLHSDQQRVRSPDSTSTVVRTPHRQSLADLAELNPAAWELFVNGISFDSSDEPMPIQEAQPKLANTGEADSPCVDNEAMTVFGGKRGDRLSMQPPDASKVLKETIQRPKAAFLDVRREKQEDPRGKAIMNSWEKPVSKHARRHTLQQPLGLDHQSKSHLQRQASNPDRGKPTTMNHITAGDALSTSMTVSQALRSCQPGDIPPPEEKTITNGSPRKRLMRNWGQWISKRRSSRSSGSSQGDIVHTEPLHRPQPVPSVVELGEVPKIPDNWAAGLTSRPGRQVAAHKSEVISQMPAEDVVRRQEARISKTRDKLSPIEERTYGRTNDCLSHGKDGTAETKSGLTNHHPPVQTKYAFTPTITTTGYGPRGLQMNSRANIIAKTERVQPLGSKHRLDTITYDLPLKTRSERNLGAYAVKLLPNPLPSEVHTRRDIETDTISKQKPKTMNQRIKRRTMPVKEGTSALISTEVASKRMSWTELGSQKAGLWDHQDLGDQSIDKPSIKTTTSTTTKDKPIAANTETKMVLRERVKRTRPEEELNREGTMVDELSILTQGPGSFPGLGTGGDNGDGCQTSSSDRLTTDDISRVPGKEYWDIFRCHLFALGLRYWERVAPVFQRKSEYWKRNERYESTPEDCFTLVLALPGLLIILAGVV